MSTEITAYIAIGANLGEPVAQVLQAGAELDALPRSRLLRLSSLYRSKPDGYAAQPDFINAVAALHTRLGPRELLTALLDIELRHGRRRAFKNAPRTLDLDLLLHGDMSMHEPGLTLPHPRMAERAFVIAPLAEIAPDILIPGHGRAVDCLARLNMNGLVPLSPAQPRCAAAGAR